MPITNQILFLLAGLGVVNGFLLAMYFLFVLKPKKWINLLFGLLLLVLCIRIGKSLFHAFTHVPRIYRQLALSTFILAGPLLFLYVRAFLSKIQKPGRIDLLHLVIPALLILIIGLRWPYESNPDLWNNYFVLMIYGVWVIYLFAAFPSILLIFKKGIKKQVTVGERWLLMIYGCVFTLCVAYVSAYFGFPYLAGPILFSIVLYVIMAFFVSKKNRSVILQEESEKYQNQKISDEKAAKLLDQLSDLMITEQMYLNKKIKLAQVAEFLHSTPHEVSQVINQRLGLSFNAYINQFRIEAACRMLKESDHLTIEGIGQEVGFNSRSAFYLAFKAVMNQTPAQYKTGTINA